MIDLLRSSSFPGFQCPMSLRGFMGNFDLGGEGVRAMMKVS